MLITLLVWLLAPSLAHAQVERYAVIIGNNEGRPDEVTLRYAEQDAERMASVLRDLGGFAPHNIVLLRGEDPSSALASLRDVEQRIAASEAEGVETVLFVYYSGHADAQALHLGATDLPLRRLSDTVRNGRSRLRLLVVDACRSGALTRTKGGTLEAPFRVDLDDRLAEEGVVFLSSTAANEEAQESDELKASFFTHYFVSALLGAADNDRDGKVSLGEAYRYTYEHTLRASSRTFAGPQHATFSYDLRGQGEVVLTSVGPIPGASKRSTLSFLRDMDYLVLQGHRDGAVVGEVSRLDAARSIQVPPGRYFIRARADDHLREGTVLVPERGALQVDPESLTRIEYARLVRKGSPIRRVSHGLQAGYRLRSSLTRGESLCHGAAIGYAIELRHLSIVPRVGYCQGSFSNERLTARTEEIDLSIHMTHVFDLPVVSLELGVVGGAGLLRQSFETTGTAPPRLTASGQLGVVFGVLWDLPRGFYFITEVAGHTYFFARTPTGGEREIATTFAARPMFGLGKRW